jgi:acyl carrier protein
MNARINEMTGKELEVQILQILKEVRPEVDFESATDLVSFEIVMLTTEFEKKFGVNIPGEEIVPDAFATIAAMAHLVRKLQTGG